MFVNAITREDVKKYIRVDHQDENALIDAFLEAAKEYVKTYTGLSDEAIATKASLTPAVFIICADLYDKRSGTEVSGNTTAKVNLVLDTILGMHSVNLI